MSQYNTIQGNPLMDTLSGMTTLYMRFDDNVQSSLSSSYVKDVG